MIFRVGNYPFRCFSAVVVSDLLFYSILMEHQRTHIRKEKRNGIILLVSDLRKPKISKPFSPCCPIVGVPEPALNKSLVLPVCHSTLKNRLAIGRLKWQIAIRRKVSLKPPPKQNSNFIIIKWWKNKILAVVAKLVWDYTENFKLICFGWREQSRALFSLGAYMAFPEWQEPILSHEINYVCHSINQWSIWLY